MSHLLRDAVEAVGLVTYHYTHVVRLVAAAYRHGGSDEK